MFAAKVGGERLFHIHVLREHPVKFCHHGFGGGADAVTQQPHGLLFSPFGIHVHVDGAVNALVDHDHREFAIDASRQNAPQTEVFGSIVLRIVDGEVPQSCPLKHHALDARADHCLDLFGVEPWPCDELGDSDPGFIGGWTLGNRPIVFCFKSRLIPRKVMGFKPVSGEREGRHRLAVYGLERIATR